MLCHAAVFLLWSTSLPCVTQWWNSVATQKRLIQFVPLTSSLIIPSKWTSTGSKISRLSPTVCQLIGVSFTASFHLLFFMQVWQPSEKSGSGVWPQQRKISVSKGMNLSCVHVSLMVRSINMISGLCSGAPKPSETCELFLLVQESFTRSTWSTWPAWCLTRMGSCIRTVWWAPTLTPPWSMVWASWAGVRRLPLFYSSYAAVGCCWSQYECSFSVPSLTRFSHSLFLPCLLFDFFCSVQDPHLMKYTLLVRGFRIHTFFHWKWLMSRCTLKSKHSTK